MKILLLGSTGQVGWELHRTLFTLGNLTALDYPQIDMADPKSIHDTVAAFSPDLIVNATAYTDVDKAESQRDLAMAINGVGPGILAEEVQKRGAGLIHYSTDFVFDGAKGSPYSEEDTPNPVNWYGESKLAGERAIQQIGGTYLIFRTSWVYSLRRPCFVTKLMEWAKTKDVLRIVDDQVSTPTWARTLAQATAQVTAQGREDPLGWLSEKSGLYHITDGGSCSRYEWAKEVFSTGLSSKPVELKHAKTTDFPSPAKRPENTTLSLQKAKVVFELHFWGWQEILRQLLREGYDY